MAAKKLITNENQTGKFVKAEGFTPAKAAMRIELEQEDDGRWIAEITQFPGMMAYGKTSKIAVLNVKTLILQVMLDNIKHREKTPVLDQFFELAPI